ncbi:hypothetical protein Tsubulata_051028 [Turnera subulata]|uniref:Uncharacterized protein n=1 Tax=Turnera subulata TaxID=218843 RepID=A0A9Q0FPB6_9ROSI|nr:hypothetical protein Tsubulata_051028 [Turnera subulata]
MLSVVTVQIQFLKQTMASGDSGKPPTIRKTEVVKEFHWVLDETFKQNKAGYRREILEYFKERYGKLEMEFDEDGKLKSGTVLNEEENCAAFGTDKFKEKRLGKDKKRLGKDKLKEKRLGKDKFWQTFNEEIPVPVYAFDLAGGSDELPLGRFDPAGQLDELFAKLDGMADKKTDKVLSEEEFDVLKAFCLQDSPDKSFCIPLLEEQSDGIVKLIVINLYVPRTGSLLRLYVREDNLYCTSFKGDENVLAAFKNTTIVIDKDEQSLNVLPFESSYPKMIKAAEQYHTYRCGCSKDAENVAYAADHVEILEDEDGVKYINCTFEELMGSVEELSSWQYTTDGENRDLRNRCPAKFVYIILQMVLEPLRLLITENLLNLTRPLTSKEITVKNGAYLNWGHICFCLWHPKVILIPAHRAQLGDVCLRSLKEYAQSPYLVLRPYPTDGRILMLKEADYSTEYIDRHMGNDFLLLSFILF